MPPHRSLVITAAFCFGIASSSLAATSPLAARLAAAAHKSALTGSALKPWHLKLTVQLYDPAGKPSETATIEQWTAGDTERRVYASHSYKATEIRHGHQLFRTANVASPPYRLALALQQITDPLPSAAEVSSSTPDERNERFGTVSLSCIMLDQPLTSVPVPPLGLFPTYCLDPESGVLRFTYLLGRMSITRNRLGTFPAADGTPRSVAIDTTVSRNDVLIEKTHIEALVAWQPDPALLTPDSSLVPVPTAIVPVEPAVMQANLLNAPPLVYSEIARRRHAAGTVLLRATISDDGHIRSLRLLSTPDPELAFMALAQVPQWTYKPYLLKGQPVEVETDIAVECKPAE